MTDIKRLFAVALLAGGAAACSTTASGPYKASTRNVLAAQTAFSGSDAKLSVASFTSASGVDITPSCRAVGALEVAPGTSPVAYIRDAFEEELFAAGVVTANGTPISGEITMLDPNSIGTGSWQIGLRLTSLALPSGYEVRTVYSFKTSFIALTACKNTVDAFLPAVNDLIGQAVRHPDFVRLAQ